MLYFENEVRDLNTERLSDNEENYYEMVRAGESIRNAQRETPLKKGRRGLKVRSFLDKLNGD